MRLRTLTPIVALLALLGTSCTLWPEKKNVHGWHHATGGEALERLFWESVQRKDWLALESHTSATFTGLINGRTLDRNATLEQLKATEINGFELAEVTVTPNGDTMTVAYVFSPQPGTPRRNMTVWQ